MSAACPLLLSIAFFSIAAKTGKLPEPVKPIVNIRFEDEYSDIKLPINLEGFLSEIDRQINTFYVWTQRLGYVPSLSGSLRSALAGAAAERGVAVVAKPKKPFKNVDEILRYVDEGAVLLILDNLAAGGYSNDILKRAGMEIVAAPITGPAEYMFKHTEESEPGKETIAQDVYTGGAAGFINGIDSNATGVTISGIMPTIHASAVSGGTAALRDIEGVALYSVTDYGKGRIAVFTDPDLFYNRELGDVSANLTDKTETLTRLALEIIRSLTKNI
jgi:hypothetical protein